jgi:flagellar protein FliO/FliZ
MNRFIAHLAALPSLSLSLLLSCPASLAHAQSQAGATPSASGQFASLMASLAIVIALILAAAWLLKRLAPKQYSASTVLRHIASTAVGQRERVVVIEIGATWLVLGVAPGSVNVLHQLPRIEQSPEASVPAKTPRSFAQWFAHMQGKQHAR